MNLCPRCDAKGRAIGPATLDAQVLPGRLARKHQGWCLCTSEDCEVVYFRGDEVVVLGETRAVPFHKSTDRKRLVCFCFEHSVAEIEADVAAYGTSTIQASIKAACKAGQDDCERKNPRGGCCLGDVGQVLKRLAPARADGAPATGCCASTVLGESAMAPAQTTVRYRVEGMTCAGCEGHAREAIEAIPGVVSVAVSYRSGSAEVVWRGAANDAAVTEATAEFGYRSSRTS